MARNRTNTIVVECYGSKQTFSSRKKAMDYFLEGMMCSEGSEHERYETIYFQLARGLNNVSDTVDYRGI